MSEDPTRTATEGAGGVEVRRVELAATLDLRSRVLRGHLPGLPAVAASDDDPDTWHLGAFRDGRLVGVMTGFTQAAPGHPAVPAERFRFMAVDPVAQGSGVGRALLDEAVSLARARGARLLWANGRDTALGFYTRLGFEVVGDGFDDATSQLPHHVVIRAL